MAETVKADLQLKYFKYIQWTVFYTRGNFDRIGALCRPVSGTLVQPDIIVVH